MCSSDLVKPKSRLSLGDNLAAGDAIVILASSGIHANGVSLARKLAERLASGYLTDVGNGENFGEARLCRVVEEVASASAADVLQYVLRAVDQFAQGVVPFDDLTLMVVRYTG